MQNKASVKNESSAVLLARVFRGENIESEHCGHIVVVDADGEILYSWGDAEQIVHMRSAAKPIQILPSLDDGIAARFGLQRQELALACASHNGEWQHTALAGSILNKIGLTEKNMQCGIHRPMGVDLAVVAEKTPYSVLQNNCSGKHAVMLAACVKNGWPVKNYLDPQHPHQQRILHTLAKMGHIPVAEIGVQIDGCSAPEFSLPLKNVATMYARLAAAKKSELNPFDLMADFPYLIAGKNRFDTAVIEAGRGRLIAKIGAEGLECIAVRGKKTLGIVISIADGNSRATPPVAVELLSALKVLKGDQLKMLSEFSKPTIYNHRNRIVGRIECALDFSSI